MPLNDVVQKLTSHLFRPLPWRNLACMRWGIICLVLFAFLPRPMQVSGMVLYYLGDGMVQVYERLFLTTEYWLFIITVLCTIAMGIWCRTLGLLACALLLPLAFLSSGNQSRHLIIVTLV